MNKYFYLVVTTLLWVACSKTNQMAVKETSKTIRNIDSVWVKDMKAHVKDGKIKSYGVICKVSFRLDKKDKDDK